MNVVDILVSIVVVTILVTIILAIVTYVAYKLRLSREPAMAEDDPSQLRYFVRYQPPEEGEEEAGEESERLAAGTMASGAPVAAVEAGSGASSLEKLDRDVADMEGHETQA